MKHSTEVKELDSSMKYSLVGALTKSLVRSGLASEKQALGTAVVFAENYTRLVTDPEEFGYHFGPMLDDAIVAGEKMETYPVIEVLNTLDYIDVVDGLVQVGSRTLAVVEHHSHSLKPVLAEVGITPETREVGYGATKGSELSREAIHTLEESEMMRSEVMLDVLDQLFRTVRNDPTRKAQLMTELHVLKGTREMKPGVAYVCEHKTDGRGRMYQVPAHGPNGQSSDLARSLYDFHGVPTDYDVNETLVVLREELADMGDWETTEEFEADVIESAENTI